MISVEPLQIKLKLFQLRLKNNPLHIEQYSIGTLAEPNRTKIAKGPLLLVLSLFVRNN